MLKDKTILINEEGWGLQLLSDRNAQLLCAHFGAPAPDFSDALLKGADRGYCPVIGDEGRDRTWSYDFLPLAFSFLGNGDFRNPGVVLRKPSGECASLFRVEDIKETSLAALIDPETSMPFPHGETRATEVVMESPDAKCALGFVRYPEALVRTLSVEPKTEGLELPKAGHSIDLAPGDWELLSFTGRHAAERQPHWQEVTENTATLSSRRGMTSHECNPAFVLRERTSGECVGFALMWSGSFTAEIQKEQFGSVRVVVSDGDERDQRRALTGKRVSPYLVMAWGRNLDDLSDKFHRFALEHVIEEPETGLRHPVLINNWEATYFGFTGEKLIAIAREARTLGCDLFVLDDGWFGKRDDDYSGLGDWFPNTEKLGMGFGELADRIRAEGTAFGFWVEPEMISEDSEAYRKGEYKVFEGTGTIIRSRHQLVVDFGDEHTRQLIEDRLAALIAETKASYIKWDFNRSISDAPGPDRTYRHVLGLYRTLSNLRRKFPSLIIEGCSGGGGRFDLGALRLTPQIWLSDNTDAINRTVIQTGSSVIYPVRAFGSHVSAVPNHQNGRTTPLFTRSCVAMMGSYGLELDPVKLTDDEKEILREEIAFYKAHGDTFRRGRTRIVRDDNFVWAATFENAKELVLVAVKREVRPNPPFEFVRLRGLDPGAAYSCEGSSVKGASLMACPLRLDFPQGEYTAVRKVWSKS